jgi:serine acetyltransferase
LTHPKLGRMQGWYLVARQIDMGYVLSFRSETSDCIVIGVRARVLGGISLGYNVEMGGNSVLLGFVAPSPTVAWIPNVKSTHPNRLPEVSKA